MQTCVLCMKTCVWCVKSLSGVIPPEIGNLGNLQFIRLFSNRIRGTIPTSISKCTKLIELMLYDNRLSGTVSSEISTLPNLAVLQLQTNRLRGSGVVLRPEQLMLDTVDISENLFSGTLPDSFFAAPNLRRIAGRCLILRFVLECSN